ncbi:hypothetical protein JIX56_30250 [Streptomyces sp. CA-210063]|uniref:hypothetical protein n=1 Tax=Streptomyces sp. CA-210063 TaxID=2801029 RepID=UPI00214B2250|nr:hypothetical protein [Streptomyces sp. CA-210063]UUU33784.1 hypothetical protein JIX56_30250 [Streptomyces sp. CA-210063]
MPHLETPSTAGSRKEPSPERSLLALVVADPGHLPELLAEFAVRRMGPAASEAITRLRRNHPDATETELRARVIARGRRAVVSEGSLVGGPFLVLIPVAFCAALLSQARTALELAALDGRDPTASARAGELLVFQGVYENTRQARDALARTGPVAEAPARWKRWAALWQVTLRMARILGVLTPGDESPEAGRHVRRVAVQASRWLLLGSVLLIGTVAPLVWLPYLAVSYRRTDARLTDRVLAYYFADSAPAPPHRASHVEPQVVGAALRALLSLLVPLVLIAVTFLTGLRIADSRWPVLGIVVATASAAVGALWYRRRHRHR